MIEVGEYCTLEVLRETPHGLFLGIKDGKESVLLPGKEIPDGTKTGYTIKVFIYNDSEDRIIATTKTPLLKRNEFGALKVKDVNKMGVFLDWGLDKDLLVPFKEQHKRMLIGESYLVFLYFDEASERLVASGNLNRFVSNEVLKVEEGEEVDLLVWDFSDAGINVIVNLQHKGLLYKNEVFQKLKPGDKVTGYVKKIRDDYKLDITLQKTGLPRDDSHMNRILEVLKENGGMLNITDKSKPGEIYELFEMSKKSYKKAAGALYKDKRVFLTKEGIEITA